jgi:hypothetical protein
LHSRRNSPAPDAQAAAAHATAGAIMPADCSQQDLKDKNENVIAGARTEQQVDALRQELYAIREGLTKRLDSFGCNYSDGASHSHTRIDNVTHVEADAIRHDLFKELERRFNELGAAAAFADTLESAPLGVKYNTPKHDHGIAGNSTAERDSSEDSTTFAQLREEFALAISGLQNELHDRLCTLSAEACNGRSCPTTTSASPILHKEVMAPDSSNEGILPGLQAEMASLRSEVVTPVPPTRELLNRFGNRLVNI